METADVIVVSLASRMPQFLKNSTLSGALCGGLEARSSAAPGRQAQSTKAVSGADSPALWDHVGSGSDDPGGAMRR
jgi:hypothetical protein